MTVAEYLKSRGYSSRLVVRLRNTPGSFFVDGTAVFSTCVLKDGNQLQVRVAEKKSSAAVEPVPMDLDILYEDTHLLVVNKPAGMAVHPSQGNHGNTLANGLADYFRKKQEAFVFRAVNRLDKDTSGLLLVAKNGLSSGISGRCLWENRCLRNGLRPHRAEGGLGHPADPGPGPRRGRGHPV